MITLFRIIKNKNKNYKARILCLSVCLSFSNLKNCPYDNYHISVSDCTPKEVQF